MTQPTVFRSGHRSNAIAPAPSSSAPSSAEAPGAGQQHAVAIGQVARAWPLAAEVEARSGAGATHATHAALEDDAEEGEQAGGRCLNERTCSWATCGLALGAILGGAAGVASVYMARATGEPGSLDATQMGAVGAVAGGALGSVMGCVFNAYCVDPALD